MRTTLAISGLIAAIGFACCQSAAAIPVAAKAIKEVVTASSTIEQAQYAERRTRHGLVKCYRTLIIGPYRCHWFTRWY